MGRTLFGQIREQETWSHLMMQVTEKRLCWLGTASVEFWEVDFWERTDVGLGTGGSGWDGPAPWSSVHGCGSQDFL